MIKLSHWLIKQSKGWVVLIAIIVFVLFMIFVLPAQAEKADEYARGNGSPDTAFFYPPEFLFELAEVYGEAGRNAYVRARFTFDLIFPLVYGVFLVTSISWLVDHSLNFNSPWRRVNLVPVAGVVFDLLENSTASLVMAGYPERREFFALLASVFTSFKWLFVYGSFFVLANVLMLWVYKKLKREN